MHIFQQYGINSLTMETILDKLDISRGTLSEIAKSKAELLDQCIEVTLSQRKEQFANIIEHADNAVEAILTLLKVNLKSITGHHPDFLQDLRNHHQPCWQKMQVFSEQHLRVYLTELFTIGMEQELFRPEINPALISSLLISHTSAIIDTGLLNTSEEQFNDVYRMGFAFYLRGLLSAKGLVILEKKLSSLSDAAII